jgi:hypothetical protein
MRRSEVKGSEAGPPATPLAPRNGARAPMSPALRAAILTLGALLWLSGVAWLVLHFAFAQQTQFGPLPNPWEAVLMRLHGVLAVGGVFFLGWIVGGHTIERWGSARKRLSGFLLVASAALLVASGYALYYTTGAPHEVASRAHEWLGAGSLLAALAHWWRLRS